MPHQLGVDVQRHLDAPGPAHSIEQPRIGGAFLVVNAEARGDHAFAFRGRAVGFGFGIFRQFQIDVENAFGAAAKHCQRTVRRHAFDCLALVEVVGEFGAVGFLARHHLGMQHTMSPEMVAQLADQFGIFGEAFHQNLARAVERRSTISDTVVGIDELGSFNLWIQRGIIEQRIGQRFQPRFDGDLRLGAALLFVGQIEIFEARFAVGEQQRLLERIGQLALLFDGTDNGDAAFFQLAQITKTFFEVTHLRVVQPARRFFAVTRDKRHRRPRVKQRDGSDDLRFARVEFLGNALFDTGQSKHAAYSFRRLRDF